MCCVSQCALLGPDVFLATKVCLDPTVVVGLMGLYCAAVIPRGTEEIL